MKSSVAMKCNFSVVSICSFVIVDLFMLELMSYLLRATALVIIMINNNTISY